MSVTLHEKPSKQSTSVDRPSRHGNTGNTSRSGASGRRSVEVRVKVKPHSNKGRLAKRHAEWIARGLGFCAVFVLTNIASSMVGQVQVEQARRAEISAKERAMDARKAESRLREQVEKLTSRDTVEQWALANGFTPAPVMGEPRREGAGLVATRL